MAQVVFSTWGRNIVDNRNISGEPTAASFKLPVAFDGTRPLRSFMGWDGLILFDKDVDVPAMTAEYMKRVQTLFCCGRCTPGKKGTKVLMDLLQNVLEGKATPADLDSVADLTDVLQHCKCTLCQSATTPVLDAVTHFRDDFLAYLNGTRTPKPASYIHKLTAPCMDKCPSHIDIPAYIEAIKNYQFGDSLATIRNHMPLPAVCGRVCPHPCETACRRKNVDDAINIMVLKRSASDYEWMHKLQPPMQPKPAKSKTVGIVGAGPAGLAAAYYLALEGYRSTIYETLPEGFGGGMIAVGIPAYRMPRHLLQRDIDIIQSMGVEIVYNCRIGKDITLPELKKKHDAVFLAPGAHRSKPMGVEGEDKGYKGFLTGGIDFLREAYMGKPTGMGKKVCVVGGGNTAIDCVRVALREGAEVSTLLYRRSRKEMPADVWEVDGAEEEGVTFEFQVLPTKIVVDANEQVTGVECVRMAMGEPDASGRRRPEPVPGSEFIVECDTVIPAIGQDPDLSFIPSDMGIDITKWNTVVTKALPLKDAAGKSLKDGMGNDLSRSLITDCDGVFAGGDAEIGPLTVVACVGNAHRAASVIQRWLEEGSAYLTEEDIFEDLLTYLGVYDKNEQVACLDSVSRSNQKEVHGKERASFKNYSEVELGFPDSTAQREADRCLRCYRVALVTV
ncbi:FAD-dependent oxidoreductase [Geobacter sp. SVR]|uniref:FAD-dependent oxidoreductase n=1 Tax=Geobacter sp. SVR TaxID=2495594 RepID=UPI00143EFA1E|nr:FAD-dependent oxidoreductase [Geobacter sp. SVR]BCS52309.1 NADPH-Fe(3+) oxidoreductase subunit beta [Geobacter sp. SVR]GCF85032.1 NADPH-Fe(3+) oxidoreductase subunit beta [Geobacter sp. SVR]